MTAEGSTPPGKKQLTHCDRLVGITSILLAG
jgi:hypothetical protein